MLLCLSSVRCCDRRESTNKPEERHSKILDMLEGDGVEVIFSDMELNFEKLVELGVHSSEMLLFLKNCYQSFIENPDKNFDYEKTGVIPYNFCRFVPEQVAKLDYWKRSGVYVHDQITPIFKNTWELSLQSANNGYNAYKYLSERQVIYCANINPGHHAGYDTIEGYCFLNNAAIAASQLLNVGYKRIIILDLDYHAGNGTENIFKNNNNVVTVSIHADPLLDYPYYTGYDCIDHENGTANFTFRKNTTLEVYLDLLSKALNFINHYEYDICIIAFGGDTYKEDPDPSNQCGCLLEINDYKTIAQFIKTNLKQAPIIVTQEGGYNMKSIDLIVKNFLYNLI